MSNDYVFDIETYPNVFTLAVEHAEAPLHWMFEISALRNDSKEIHNFHMHQSKFEVLDVKRTKDYPQPEVGAPAAASRPLLNLGAPGIGKLVDTYPIDVDGVIMLRVTFDQAEQLGTYVFHCHILEHEDKGMMSLIQVMNLN